MPYQVTLLRLDKTEFRGVIAALNARTGKDGGVNVVTRHTFSTGRSPVRLYRASPTPASPGWQLSLHVGLYTPDPLDGAEYPVETPGLQTVNKAYTVGTDHPHKCARNR